MYRQELARLQIFQGLSPSELDLVDSITEHIRLPKDQVIFEQGQRASHLYILQEGQVVIRFKPYDGPPLTVARIEPGGVFGWSAALHRDTYTSSAVAEMDSEAFCIPAASLYWLCDQCPDTGNVVLQRLAKVVSERLRSTHTPILNILRHGMDESS